MNYPTSDTFDIFDWSPGPPNTLAKLSESFGNPILVTGKPKIYYDDTKECWSMSSSGEHTSLRIPIEPLDHATLEMQIIPSDLPPKLSKAKYVGIVLYNPGGPSGGVLLAQEGLGIIKQKDQMDTLIVEKLQGTEELVQTPFTLRLVFNVEQIQIYAKREKNFVEFGSWFPFSFSAEKHYVYIDLLGDEDDPLAFSFSSLRLGIDVATDVAPLAVITGPIQARIHEIVKVSGLSSVNPTKAPLDYIWEFKKPERSKSFLTGYSQASLTCGDLIVTAVEKGSAGNLLKFAIVYPDEEGSLSAIVTEDEITIILGFNGGIYTSVTELVEAFNTPGHPAFNIALLEKVVLSGQGDDPPPPTPPTSLGGGIDSTLDSPIFVPDVPGHYTVGLKVSAEGMESDTAWHTIAVGQASILYGAEPDISIIRKQVAQPFFNLMENNAIIETMWRGLARLVSADLLNVIQARLNIHMDLAPLFLRRKWVQIKMFEESATPLSATWTIPMGPLSGTLTPLDDDDGDTTTTKAKMAVPKHYTGVKIGSLDPSFIATILSPSEEMTICTDQIICAELIDSGRYGYTEGKSIHFYTKYQLFSGIKSGDRLYIMGLYKDILSASSTKIILAVDPIVAPYPTPWKVFRPITKPLEWHVLAPVDLGVLAGSIAIGDILSLEATYTEAEKAYTGTGEARVFAKNDSVVWFSASDLHFTLREGTAFVQAYDGSKIITKTNLLAAHPKIGEDWAICNITKGGSLLHILEIAHSGPLSYGDTIVLKDSPDTPIEEGDLLAIYSPIIWHFAAMTVKCLGFYHSKSVNLPERIFEIPVLRESLLFEDPCYVLNEDYTISGEVLTFVQPFTLENLPPRNLWAEHVFMGNWEAAQIYGPFVNIPNLDKHPNRIMVGPIAKALVAGAISGPVRSILKRSLGIAGGLPFAYEEATIIDKYKNNLTFQYPSGKIWACTTSTPDDFNIGDLVPKYGLLEHSIALFDYLDGQNAILPALHMNLVNQLDKYHAFVATLKHVTPGAETMVAQTLAKMKPAWQRALLVFQKSIDDQASPLDYPKFVIKQLVADVITSYEDPDHPVICGTAFMFDDPAHFFKKSYDDIVIGGGGFSAQLKENAEERGVHKGWLLIDHTIQDYAWVTGVEGNTVKFDYGMAGHQALQPGDEVHLQPGYSEIFDFPFNQFKTRAAQGGSSKTLIYPASEIKRLNVSVGWRVHNTSKNTWGLISSVEDSTITFTKDMEPDAAPNEKGDRFYFYPPSGPPGHHANDVLYLGPMAHADYRAVEIKEGMQPVISRERCHTEFIDPESIIPPNYPIHPRSLEPPAPVFSFKPVLTNGQVDLKGHYFSLGLIVKFNGELSPEINIISDTEATAVLPELPPGKVDVRIENDEGIGSTWPSAFEV